MKESSHSMRWCAAEVALLKEFVLSQRRSLLEYFYKNIFVGELKVRKPRKFFVEMAKTVGRTAEQCKSKFQKFEQRVFEDFLSVPKEHFEVFQWLRNMRCKWRKWEKAKKKSKGVVKIPEVEGEHFRRLETARKKILDAILGSQGRLWGFIRHFWGVGDGVLGRFFYVLEL